MAYSHTTFSTLKSQLASRLNDPTNVFWLDVELGLYLKEALRTWNSAAQFHRDRTVFNTSNGVAFYDLTDTTSTGAGATNPPAYLGYSLKERDLINDIQYHLLESVNDWGASVTWGGTEMFTMADLTQAIERRRNQFLLETGLHLTRSTTVFGSPPGSGRVTLSDAVIDVRRVSWLPATVGSKYVVLWRVDEWDAGAFKPKWAEVTGTPEAHSVFMTPKVGLQLIPVSNDSGTLDLVTVQTGATLDESTGVLLKVPDDLAWGVKWGALADLLSREGQSMDPLRAQYAEQRWRECLAVAQALGTVQQGQLNGVTLQLTTLAELDFYSPSWQNSSGTPDFVGVAGRNMIVLADIPDAGPYSVTLDVIRNAPVPTFGSDQVQIGREHLDVILDYGVHLASFKLGGAEFQATIPLYENFMRLAIEHGNRLRAEALSWESLRMVSKKEESDRPRRWEAA